MMTMIISTTDLRREKREAETIQDSEGNDPPLPAAQPLPLSAMSPRVSC